MLSKSPGKSHRIVVYSSRSTIILIVSHTMFIGDETQSPLDISEKEHLLLINKSVLQNIFV